jgi:hypothetical protein
MEVHQWSGEMWDQPFVDYVDNILDKKNLRDSAKHPQ